MGEAILTRAGGGGINENTINDVISNATLKYITFDSSGTFTVPKTGNYDVLCCGGGGGGGGHNAYGSSWGKNNYGGGGGGSGYINRNMVYLTAGASVSVTVGNGGSAGNEANGTTGGTSSFGTYLSASGGLGGNRGYAKNAKAIYQGTGGLGRENGEDCTGNRANGGSGIIPPDQMNGNMYGKGGYGELLIYNSDSGTAKDGIRPTDGISGCVWIGWY